MLAVEHRRSREQLAALLWPESDETRARGALRRTLSVLTTGLGDDWVQADRQSVTLRDDADVDLRRTDVLAMQVATHNHPGQACGDCRVSLDELVALHRGPFLDGFALRDAADFDVWRSEEVERRRRQFVQALERRSELEVLDGDLDAALESLRRWRDAEPLNEQVHGRLIRLHGQRGERLEAVHVYRECIAVLERELGVAPLDATTRLYQSVVAGEPPPTTARAGRGPTTVARPSRPPRAVRATRTPPEFPMVGRDADLEAVQHHLDQPGALAVVEGEAGIGKTRFIEELEARLHRSSLEVLAARCHRGEEGLAFGPIVQVLRDSLRRPDVAARVQALAEWQRAEAARLVPELVEAHTIPTTDTSDGRLRFLEALVATLDAVGAPDTPAIALLLEDVHLADEGTRDLLVYLARRPEQSRLRLVVSRRQVDAGAHVPWADPTMHDRALVVSLGRLAPADVRALCEHAMGTDVEAVAGRLQEETDGLPLALVQFLDWLIEEGADADGPWPLPTGLREVVAERLAELDETTTQVAAATAVIGHGVDLHLLIEVSGRSEDETAAALDALLERGIVVATRDGTFEFTHEWVRSVAYEDCSPARQRLLHARVVTALTSRAGDRGGGRLAARIAEHARAAGLRQEAAHWSVLAGDQSLRVFANDDALEHFESALALEPAAPGTIHARIARVHVLAGDYEAALTAYEAAAALAEDEGELTLVEHELGALYVRRREWAAARLHLEAALAGSHTTDPRRTARIRADVGLTALQRGDLEEAELQAREALAAAESVEDREALAQARNLAGMIARRRGAVGEAQRHLEHAAALAAHLRDPSAYIAALNNLALTTAEAGDVERAEQLLCTALDRCRKQGDRHRQAALLNNLADVHHLRGDDHGAHQHLVEAVAVFREVGGDLGGSDEHPPDPEVWKLVEW